ncbi:MAG: PKD domain-containing protein [Pseudomonadota bacterium]
MHALLLAAALSTTAHAWDLTGYAWDVEDGPITWYLIGSDAMPAEDYEDEVLAAFEVWTEQDPCLAFEFAYGGILTDTEGGSASDGLTTITLGDPDNTLGTGVFAASYLRASSELIGEVLGWYIYALTEADIILNPDYDWVTLEEMDAGGCDGAMVLEAVLAHEVGHLLGLGNACDDGGLCSDEELAAAMYWALHACDTQGMEPNGDDLQGLSALYGVYVGVSLRSASGGDYGETATWAGPLPLELCFAAASNGAADDFAWDFGDGATAAGEQVCHTWTTEGHTTVALEGTRTSDGCSGQDSLDILACTDLGSLEPGLASFTATGDTTGQAGNAVPAATVGCIEVVTWEAWRDGELAWISVEWEPEVVLPGPGSYLLRLTVSGPGGSYVDELEVVVEEGAGEGCGCHPTGSAAGAWGLLGLLPLWRRRRRAPGGQNSGSGAPLAAI